MTEIQDDYLGDGVYASFDGFHVVLDLRAQGSDRIALEPSVLAALDRFRKRIDATYGVDYYAPEEPRERSTT